MTATAPVGAGWVRPASTDELHRRYASTREPAVAAELLARYDRLAVAVARRFPAHRAEDDLEQVARIALWHALERFDPERGIAFTTYAWSTISGELRRFFRDHTWGARVSRGLQERYAEVSRLADDMNVELGRSPTIPELAVRAKCSVSEVVEALEVRGAREPGSVDDQPLPVASGAVYDAVDLRVALARGLQCLPDRDRHIVELRYWHDLTQEQIGRIVGLSQMQVSRVLKAALRRLEVVVPRDVA